MSCTPAGILSRNRFELCPVGAFNAFARDEPARFWSPAMLADDVDEGFVFDPRGLCRSRAPNRDVRAHVVFKPERGSSIRIIVADGFGAPPGADPRTERRQVPSPWTVGWP